MLPEKRGERLVDLGKAKMGVWCQGSCRRHSWLPREGDPVGERILADFPVPL